jgi:opine dehydrogenase
LLEAADAERLALASAYGVDVPSVLGWLRQTYGFEEPTLRAMFHRLTHDPSGPYQWTPTPPSMEHKYILEDVPCGLVPMTMLGRAAGLRTPVIDGLVAIASALCRRDFIAEGRTLERLGLAGQSVPDILRIAERSIPD